MQIKIKMKTGLSVLLMGCALSSFANQMPRALGTDSRMRVVPYDSNNVITVVGNQLITTSLEFGKEEVVQGVEGGDSVAWLVTVNKAHPNIVFIKPTMDQSDTNLTVLTDKYTYHFRLLMPPKNSTSDIPSAQPTYNIRFTYPQEEQEEALAHAAKLDREKNALVANNGTNPMDWNWNYTYSARCSRDNVPVRAFDDGRFTYFQFAPHASIPAIFLVDAQGHESLANFSMKGAYVVIQKTSRQFSLRSNGKENVSCVFNENYQA